MSHCFPVISQTPCNHGDRDNTSRMCVVFLLWELIAMQHEYIDNIFCFVCQSYIITILHSGLSSTIICGSSAMRAGLRHFVFTPSCVVVLNDKRSCIWLPSKMIHMRMFWSGCTILTGWQAPQVPIHQHNQAALNPAKQLSVGCYRLHWDKNIINFLAGNSVQSDIFCHVWVFLHQIH